MQNIMVESKWMNINIATFTARKLSAYTEYSYIEI